MPKSIADFLQNAPIRFSSASWLTAGQASQLAPARHSLRPPEDPHNQAWVLAPLIAGQPAYLNGRWIGGHFSYPMPSTPPHITRVLPPKPAAVLVHGIDGSVRTLCLDLDTSRARKAVVDNDAASLARLFVEVGLAFVEDFSPSGGRHMYVPLQEPITAAEAREIVEALELRTTSLDPKPHQNVTSGCIRVPGTVHKRGGHQILITPLAEAYGILTRRNPAHALVALRRSLAPELYLLKVKKQQRQARAKAATAALDQTKLVHRTPSVAHKDLPLRSLARTGMYDTAKYPSDSEARMAVLNHLVSCGWTLDQVRKELTGSFTGLAALFGHKIEHLLTFEWDKALAFAAPKDDIDGSRKKIAHNSHTSPTLLTPGNPQSENRALQQLVNDIENVLYAVLDQRFTKLGREGISLRFLMRAVLAYMRTTGSNVIDVGCRTFAVALGKDHGTVAKLLPQLEKASSGILTRTQRGRGRDADTYLVELPAEFAQLARELTWRKGKIHAIRPVFRVLGDVAALTYEAIERGRLSPTTAELARTTGISRRALIDHLSRMEALQMIRRHHGNWEIVSVTDLLKLADRLGATVDRQAQINRYRKQRADWHAWLDRNLTPQLIESELYDAEIDEYWLPPTDDPEELQHSIWHAA